MVGQNFEQVGLNMVGLSMVGQNLEHGGLALGNSFFSFFFGGVVVFECVTYSDEIIEIEKLEFVLVSVLVLVVFALVLDVVFVDLVVLVVHVALEA